MKLQATSICSNRLTLGPSEIFNETTSYWLQKRYDATDGNACADAAQQPNSQLTRLHLFYKRLVGSLRKFTAESWLGFSASKQ